MKKYNSLKRDQGKWHDILPIAVIWSVMIAWTIFLWGSTPIETAILNIFSKDGETTEFLGLYFGFIKVWIIFIPIMMIKYNRPMLGQLALTRGGNTLSGSLIGLLLGFTANGACILLSAIKGDIDLSFRSFNPGLLLLFFIVVFVQCGAEEIIDRLYLYQKLRRRYNLPVFAIAGSTVAFVLNHLFAPGFSIIPALMIAGCGVLFSLFVFYYDCFWAAIMFHTAWNFSQSIIFGLPNSGIVSSYSMFTIDVSTAQDGFFYDTVFGVEGSIGAVLIFAILCSALIWRNHGKGEKKDIWE